MRSKYWMYLCPALLGASLFAACASSQQAPGNQTANANANAANDLPYATAPLPDNGYKAKLTILDPPKKLRAGQKQIIQIKVQNTSDILWKVRGGGADNKFYIAVGDRWFDGTGEKLLNQMDGRHGLANNLKPGEETEVPLQITTPKDPGEYTLEIDLVQEQVAWFNAKGSPTARVKVKVE